MASRVERRETAPRDERCRRLRSGKLQLDEFETELFPCPTHGRASRDCQKHPFVVRFSPLWSGGDLSIKSRRP
eukprot:2832324-Pyramimonas_sp.AAC.1